MIELLIDYVLSGIMPGIKKKKKWEPGDVCSAAVPMSAQFEEYPPELEQGEYSGS